MRTLIVSLLLFALLALVVVAVLRLAGRSAQTFMDEKKRRRHAKTMVRMPDGDAHGKRARKK